MKNKPYGNIYPIREGLYLQSRQIKPIQGNWKTICKCIDLKEAKFQKKIFLRTQYYKNNCKMRIIKVKIIEVKDEKENNNYN